MLDNSLIMCLLTFALINLHNFIATHVELNIIYELQCDIFMLKEIYSYVAL